MRNSNLISGPPETSGPITKVITNDLRDLQVKLATVREHVKNASHDLLAFQETFLSFVTEPLQPASVSQAYNVARAIMNWEFGLDDLVATSKRLLDEATILNIEMSILESANDALQRQNKENENVRH